MRPSTEKITKLLEEKDRVSKELSSTMIEKATINIHQPKLREQAEVAFDKCLSALEKKLSQIDKKLNLLTLQQAKLVEEYNEKVANNPVGIPPIDTDNLEEGINFREDCMLLKGKIGVGKYFYSNPSVVVTPGDKRITMPRVDKKFVMTIDDWKRILKSASVLKLKHLQISERGLTVFNNNGGAGNIMRFEIDYDQFSGKPVFLHIENLSKLLPAHYDVEICDTGIAHFISRDENYKIEFFIALEKPGKYKVDDDGFVFTKYEDEVEYSEDKEMEVN